MKFTGKLHYELFTDELFKRLQTRYPLDIARNDGYFAHLHI